MDDNTRNRVLVLVDQIRAASRFLGEAGQINAGTPRVKGAERQIAENYAELNRILAAAAFDSERAACAAIVSTEADRLERLAKKHINSSKSDFQKVYQCQYARTSMLGALRKIKARGQ